MRSKRITFTWLLSVPLALSLVASVAGVASAAPQDEGQDAETDQLPQLSELTEEEAAILADALERIQMLRQRRKPQQQGSAAAGEVAREDELDKSGWPVEQQAAEEAVDALEEAVEQRAEQLAEAVEAWAEKFGTQAEDWAESFAEDMEAWAEDYAEDWEQWAEEHGARWEQWAERFAGKWEAWSEKFEDAELSNEEMSDVLRENLEMIQQMPLSELYGQLSKSSRKFKDLPWDRLHEIEHIVQKSLRQSLESVAQMSADSADSAEQQERIRLLHKSLQQLSAGLRAKRSELEAAATQMMQELNHADVDQAKARAKEAQQRLAEIYQRALAERTRAQELQDQLRVEIDAARTREQAVRRALRLGDQPTEEALQLRKEIAERVAIDRHEQELDSMRAEIEALRAEVEALRARRQAEQADSKSTVP